jgi:hypothetical protein
MKVARHPSGALALHPGDDRAEAIPGVEPAPAAARPRAAPAGAGGSRAPRQVVPGVDQGSVQERLSLQLLLQLIEEAPVGALGDELLWTRLDHAGFVEAQSVEAYGVLHIVGPPAVVGNLPHRL